MVVVQNISWLLVLYAFLLPSIGTVAQMKNSCSKTALRKNNNLLSLQYDIGDRYHIGTDLDSKL